MSMEKRIKNMESLEMSVTTGAMDWMSLANIAGPSIILAMEPDNKYAISSIEMMKTDEENFLKMCIRALDLVNVIADTIKEHNKGAKDKAKEDMN